MTTATENLTSEDKLLEEARRALEVALAAGADDAVARVDEGRATSYSYRDGQLEKVQQSASRSLSVALYVDGRFSRHESNDLRPETLQSFLAEAVALTRALEPDPHRKLPAPALYEGRDTCDLDLVDPAVRALSRDDAMAWLQSMDAASHADERVISSTNHLELGESSMGRVSSNGFAGTDHSTRATVVTEVSVRDAGDKRPEAYAYSSVRHLEDLQAPADVAGEALSRALARMGTEKGKTQRSTIVVHREAAYSLLQRIFSALSGGAIQQGRSFLKERLGQTIGSPLLTIRDNPLRPRGLASRAFDGEGIATKVRPVITGGELDTFFIDTYYASKLDRDATTGSTSNLEIPLGEKGLAELCKDAGNGIHVTSWNGGNADITNGDFSFGLSGHVIENGLIGRPIGEMNLTGNYVDLLANLVAIGNDPFECAPLRTPTLVIEGAQLSGA